LETVPPHVSNANTDGVITQTIPSRMNDIPSQVNDEEHFPGLSQGFESMRGDFEHGGDMGNPPF
jgi:hypothetical protein